MWKLQDDLAGSRRKPRQAGTVSEVRGADTDSRIGGCCAPAPGQAGASADVACHAADAADGRGSPRRSGADSGDAEASSRSRSWLA